ncbi:hypothetical protein AtNW77_Chr2g0255431 [Arabidopsis thaliana]
MSLLHKWEIDAAMILRSHTQWKGKAQVSFYSTLWNEMKVKKKKSQIEKPYFCHNCVLLPLLQSHISFSLSLVSIVLKRERATEVEKGTHAWE